MMDFPAAMRAIVNGEAITRAYWDEDEAYCDLTDGVLSIHNDTGTHSWVITISDMMADDWVVYEDLS